MTLESEAKEFEQPTGIFFVVSVAFYGLEFGPSQTNPLSICRWL